MKYAAYWWGIQFLAETEEDKHLLEELNKSLKPGKPDISYEGGEHRMIMSTDFYEEEALEWSEEELSCAKCILEFER